MSDIYKDGYDTAAKRLKDNPNLPLIDLSKYRGTGANTDWEDGYNAAIYANAVKPQETWQTHR